MKIDFGIATGLALLLAACGGEAPATDRQEAAPAAASSAQDGASDGSGYDVIDVTNGGVIRGMVSFAGTVPEGRRVSVTEDTDACGNEQEIYGLRVGQNGGLMHSVVSLVDITSGARVEIPSTPAALVQDGCVFGPHILVAPVDEVVEVVNSDPITHNIHTVAFANRPLNRAQPSAVETIEVSFMAAEKVRVRCDMHEWMGAWIVVVDHPYHAVTDATGGFLLENVPPGTYQMEVWHETLGAVTQEVTVTAGEESQVDVEMTSGAQQ